MLFRKPIVCGISCLGMDHIDVLGDTIDEIADHKAGIMKHGVPAFTIQQEAGGMDVIAARATEVGTSVRVAPKLSDYPGPLPGFCYVFVRLILIFPCRTRSSRRASTVECYTGFAALLVMDSMEKRRTR
eukprot:m.240260 g.240260  ORF g.240260 m.240260 type:complete len:129 (+) comp40193_c0_seq52:355-741(+)